MDAEERVLKQLQELNKTVDDSLFELRASVDSLLEYQRETLQTAITRGVEIAIYKAIFYMSMFFCFGLFSL